MCNTVVSFQIFIPFFTCDHYVVVAVNFIDEKVHHLDIFEHESKSETLMASKFLISVIVFFCNVSFIILKFLIIFLFLIF